MIFGGALTLALSTPVWRRVKYVVKFPFHPFETAENDSATEETDPNSATAKKAKRYWRRFKKVKKTENYRERDFWEVNQERKGDRYEIPAQNKRSGEQPSDKGPSWRSSHKSWSWGKAGKKANGKAGNNDPPMAVP